MLKAALSLVMGIYFAGLLIASVDLALAGIVGLAIVGMALRIGAEPPPEPRSRADRWLDELTAGETDPEVLAAQRKYVIDRDLPDVRGLEDALERILAGNPPLTLTKMAKRVEACPTSRNGVHRFAAGPSFACVLCGHKPPVVPRQFDKAGRVLRSQHAMRSWQNWQNWR